MMTLVSSAGPCRQCSKPGLCRCSVCKTWYCSPDCQALHWPTHWRECLPLPQLEWPQINKDDQTSQTKIPEKTAEAKKLEAVSSKISPLVDTNHIIETKAQSPEELEKPKPAAVSRVKVHASTESPMKIKDIASATPSSSESTTTAPVVTPTVETPAPEQTKCEDKKSAAPAPEDKDQQSVQETLETPVPSKQKSSKPAAAIPAPANQTSASKSKMYDEAFSSEKLPTQDFPFKSWIIVPPEEVISPNNFIIRFLEQVTTNISCDYINLYFLSYRRRIVLRC